MGGAAAGAAEGLAPASAPRLYPHDAQKRLPVPFTCPHCGQVTVPPAAPGAAEGRAARGAATGAGGAGGGTGAGGGGGMGTATAGTPCGGVAAENGFAATARGSSAPQPKQNL